MHALFPVSARSPLHDPAPRRAAPSPTAAQDFEAMFLAEMLTRAGLEKALTFESGFGGEAMASYYIQEIASRLAETGKFGLAEKIDRRLP